ncbi:serine hydrolase domain-containing protein [Streptomyces hesseae]|uniref:Serine hydrolase domain-containing protein n=1 Tax=Streptomyces hesseae TaxID=3075519 RepID=A0ABU2SQ95_9ACTN|nr:serine hydrolase domain-containing protein [Streptomyces sp. DSM 40473]MDT0451168.1 serine hydrolase domain-containing protein [Streptomyces sp. DSM 40473]
MTARSIRRALTGFVVAATAAGALTATAPAASAAPGPERGHRATQDLMDAGVKAGVPGVLGQARERLQDKTLTWNGSSGVADLDTHRPRLPEDRFRVGSISKVFASVVLLQLEAEGRLSLDDTVESRLPGVLRGNGGHDGRNVTIRQLLNHSSGIYNYTEDPGFKEYISTEFMERRFETRTPRELVDVALRHDPYFAPGKGFHYSNTNYIVAGMIVEKVTGRSYATEITQRVIHRAGLRSTTYPGTSSAMPNPHGRAYSKLLKEEPDAKVHDVTELNPSWGGSAGAIISTTGDLNRLYSALLGGKLLPGKQQRELLTAIPMSEGAPGGYGLGVMRATLSCGVTVWTHSGGIHGSTSLVVSDEKGTHTAAFNYNGDWHADLPGLIQAEYCGPAKPTGAARDTLNKLTSLR